MSGMTSSLWSVSVTPLSSEACSHPTTAVAPLTAGAALCADQPRTTGMALPPEVTTGVTTQ